MERPICSDNFVSLQSFVFSLNLVPCVVIGNSVFVPVCIVEHQMYRKSLVVQQTFAEIFAGLSFVLATFRECALGGDKN